jgi:hypothetical protein
VVMGVLALSVLGQSATVQASQTSSTVLTSLRSGHFVAVDAAHAHTIIEGRSATTSGVDVLQLRSYTGALVTSVNLPTGDNWVEFGGSTIAVSFESGADLNHILLYNASTLAQVANVNVGFRPLTIAVAGGQVWMTAGGDSDLHSVEVAAPHALASYPGLVGQGTLLDGALGSPATVYDRDSGLLTAISVAGTPTVTGTHTVPVFQGMATVEGGSDIAVAESTSGVELLDPVTLAVDNTLTTPGRADAVAWSQDGTRLVITDTQNSGFDHSAMYWVEDTSGSVLYTDVLDPELANTETGTAPVAFTSDTSFSMIGAPTYAPPNPTLYRFTVPSTTPSLWTSIQASGSTVLGVGQQASYSGTLYASPQAGVSGATIHVLVTPPGGTQSEVTTVTAAADGSFSYASDPLGHTGQWQFEFEFLGANGYAESSISRSVTVDGTSDSLTLSAPTKVVLGGKIAVTATLSPFTPAADITITKKVNGVTSTIFSGPVDSSGTVTLQLKPGFSTTYQAAFAGDGTYNPAASPAHKVAVLPIITGAWVGGYAVSGSYRLFHYSTTCVRTHNGGCPHFSALMRPKSPGKYVYMTLQGHTSSGWKSIAQYRHKLGASSKALFPLAYLNTGVINHNYRVAMTYEGSTTLGAVTWGFWYFRITH